LIAKQSGGKNTLSFFLRWLFCGWQKNESVFCAVAIKFLRGGFKKEIYFLKRWH
jgi:hypothetical protein